MMSRILRTAYATSQKDWYRLQAERGAEWKIEIAFLAVCSLREFGVEAERSISSVIGGLAAARIVF